MNGELREWLERVDDKLDRVGEQVAAIDERTRQHEARMDRADRRAAGWGAIGGLLAGAGAWLAQLLRGN